MKVIYLYILSLWSERSISGFFLKWKIRLPEIDLVFVFISIIVIIIRRQNWCL